MRTKLLASAENGWYRWTTEAAWAEAGATTVVPLAVPPQAFLHPYADRVPVVLMGEVIVAGAPSRTRDLPERFLVWPDGGQGAAALLDRAEVRSLPSQAGVGDGGFRGPPLDDPTPTDDLSRAPDEIEPYDDGGEP